MLSTLTAPEPDQTLEILMTELDPDVMSIFTREECLDAAEATKVCPHVLHLIVIQFLCLCLQKSGIDKIIPNMIIDDFLFEPCGYSMNGVTKNVSKILIQSSLG